MSVDAHKCQFVYKIHQMMLFISLLDKTCMTCRQNQAEECPLESRLVLSELLLYSTWAALTFYPPTDACVFDLLHRLSQVFNARILFVKNNVPHRDSENQLLLAIVDKSLQLFENVLVSVEIRHMFLPTIHYCTKISLQRIFR